MTFRATPDVWHRIKLFLQLLILATVKVKGSIDRFALIKCLSSLSIHEIDFICRFIENIWGKTNHFNKQFRQLRQTLQGFLFKLQFKKIKLSTKRKAIRKYSFIFMLFFCFCFVTPFYIYCLLRLLEIINIT